MPSFLPYGHIFMSRFDDLFWLVEVVESGSLTAAAEKNSVTSAAVSKRLRLMEERLGVKLLVRNTRHMRLTESGQHYYQRGKGLLDEFSDLEENIVSANNRLSGNIRINIPLSFGLKSLSNIFHEFMLLYPEVNLTVHLEDRYIDMINSDYDLVLRISKLENLSPVSQPIASVAEVCCASPDYLARHGTPEKPQDLTQQHCLIYAQGGVPQTVWQFKQGQQLIEVPVQGSLHANNGDFLAQAACYGRGITMLPWFIVKEALEEGALQTVLEDYTQAPYHVYAMYPTRNFLPLRVKHLIDFLKAQLSVQ